MLYDLLLEVEVVVLSLVLEVLSLVLCAVLVELVEEDEGVLLVVEDPVLEDVLVSVELDPLVELCPSLVELETVVVVLLS